MTEAAPALTITHAGQRHGDLYRIEVEDGPFTRTVYILATWPDAEGFSWQFDRLPLSGYVDHRDGSSAGYSRAEAAGVETK